MRDLGKIKNAEVIQRLVDLKDRFVVDAGCGNLTFTKILVQQGAKALAVDPDPVQAAKHRQADPVPGITFIESSADKIPVADATVDGVFFSYSLHHMPAQQYPAIYDEVCRVLKPDGFLYVLEPIDCPLNQVMRLFHNEDAERQAAWQSLHDLAAERFQEIQQFTYHDERTYESWDDFANQFASKSFNTLYTEDDVRQEKVRVAFEEFGGPDHCFQSPKNVMLLKRLASTD